MRNIGANGTTFTLSFLYLAREMKSSLSADENWSHITTESPG